MSKILFDQAVAFYKANEFDKAIDIFNKLLETKPEGKKGIAIYSKLAGAYFKNSQYDMAIKCYEILLSEYRPIITKQQLHNYCYWNAESADKTGNFYKTIKYYSLALKEGHPDKKNINFKIAEINYKDFTKTGNMESAKFGIIYYNKALKNKHTEIAKIHFKLGEIYTILYKQGIERHFKDAEVEYLEALKHTESHKAIIHQKLGYIYVKNGELDKAKAHCHESMKLGNKSCAIHTIYGEFKLKSLLFEEAIKYFEYALRADDCAENFMPYISNLISKARKELLENEYPKDPGAPAPPSPEPSPSPDSGNASPEYDLSGSRKRSLEDMLGYNPSDLPRKNASFEESNAASAETIGSIVDYNIDGL